MPQPNRVELFYFPRSQPAQARATDPELLEVVFFAAAPLQPLNESREGQIVALFVYSGDAVAYATQRQGSIQTFLNSEGEVAAIFSEISGQSEADIATPGEGGIIHTYLEPGRAFSQQLWGVVVRPSRTRLAK